MISTRSIKTRKVSSDLSMFQSARRWIGPWLPSLSRVWWGAAAMVAVVYFLIDCMKKAGTAIPSYARIATHDSEKSPQVVHSSPSGVSLTSRTTPPGSNQELPEIRNLSPIQFTSEQLAAITNTYKETLGSGGYGDVHKGKLPDGRMVAVKLLKNADDKWTKEQFVKEATSIGGTNHKNIVRLYGYCFDGTPLALVDEYMEKSLDTFLIGDMKEIDWPKVHKIVVGTAKGIAYLHEECEPKIVHCDIEPGNILLDRNFSLKVADFGLAKLYENGRIFTSGFHGTPSYCAPEMRELNFMTHKCDVYSFGMLLLEIVERRRIHNENQSESTSTLLRGTWYMPQNNEGSFGNNSLPEFNFWQELILKENEK